MSEYFRLKELGVIAYDQRTEMIRGSIIDILPDGDRRRPHKFSIAEYDRMGELGLIPEKTELIRGEVIDKMGQGDLHDIGIETINRYLSILLPNSVSVRCQCSLALATSVCLPDIVVCATIKQRRGLHPVPSNTFLLIEVSDSTRTSVFERRCALDGASGALIRALIDAVGNKDEEALYQAGLAEILDADRAFAQTALGQGLPNAMATFAAEEGRVFPPGAPAAEGREGIVAHFQGWTEGDVLRWAPAGADVSARGDMGYSWGAWTLTRASGEASRGNYVSVWRRDPDGAWRYAANIAN